MVVPHFAFAQRVLSINNTSWLIRFASCGCSLSFRYIARNFRREEKWKHASNGIIYHVLYNQISNIIYYFYYISHYIMSYIIYIHHICVLVYDYTVYHIIWTHLISYIFVRRARTECKFFIASNKHLNFEQLLHRNRIHKSGYQRSARPIWTKG